MNIDNDELRHLFETAWQDGFGCATNPNYKKRTDLLTQKALDLFAAQRQALRDEVEKAVQSLVVNDLEAVRAKNKHLDSRLYQCTVSEASGYIKAVKDATKAISTIFEGKEKK